MTTEADIFIGISDLASFLLCTQINSTFCQYSRERNMAILISKIGRKSIFRSTSSGHRAWKNRQPAIKNATVLNGTHKTEPNVKFH
jgi:hypothetical protein